MHSQVYLDQLVQYAHLYGSKVYVTLNTLLYDEELMEAQQMIHQLYNMGIDALIIQDLGILKMDLPPISLHASTQCHNDSLERVQFLQKAGFKRAILAREMDVETIRSIHEQCDMELETFIHGALCVCYSGQCYMSEMMTGRSGNRGACAFDDEGVPGQKTYMVRDGRLESYLHDRISASYYGVAPTGNGRRESFRYNPIPRMRATYMESGSDGTLDDLVTSVKKGIYVDQFANGEVKIGEGDFTFYVKSGFLIENGRLTMPVKDINIIGNGPQALADIRAVASDLKIDDSTWTCGKDQSVAVSCGIPSVLIDNLTVGGE